MRIQTNYVHRFHLNVDPEAQVLDCFRVHVLDSNLLVCQGNRQNVTLNRLWLEMLDTVEFLRKSFKRRDHRQFGLHGPFDLDPFAVIVATEEARERVRYQVGFDMMIYESSAQSSEHPHYQPHANDHMRRVQHLIDIADGLQWLEMN